MIWLQIKVYHFYLLKCAFLCLVCFYQQRIISCHRPTKGDFIDTLSSDCQVNLIPLLSSYFFNNLVHIFLNSFLLIHCWKSLWHVEPEPNYEGSIFHWHPVLRIYRIPSNTFLKGIVGRPTVFFGFSHGKRTLIFSHNLSEILVMVDTFFLFRLLKKGTRFHKG